MDLDAPLLEEALTTLGELLASRGHRFEVAVIGGGGLLLLGVIKRATKDLDIVAVIDSKGLLSAEPLPPPLREARDDIAAALGLWTDWLNPGPTSLLEFGLPQGFGERTTKRDFGGIVVHVAGRFDQICFKFYAAVDQGPRSKHFQDLRMLNPTREELTAAAAWAGSHDPSEGFRLMSKQLLAMLHADHDDAR